MLLGRPYLFFASYLACLLQVARAVVEVRAEKKLRVAINGFGRIGRTFVRCWHGRKNSLLDVVAINDSGERLLSLASRGRSLARPAGAAWRPMACCGSSAHTLALLPACPSYRHTLTIATLCALQAV